MIMAGYLKITLNDGMIPIPRAIMVNAKRIWDKKYIEIIMINVGVGLNPKSNPPFRDIKYRGK